jgi:hypothetical protein
MERLARSLRESEESDLIQRWMSLCRGSAGRAVLSNRFEVWFENPSRNGRGHYDRLWKCHARRRRQHGQMRDMANLATGRTGLVVVVPDGARRRGEQKCRQRKRHDKGSSSI